jgi:hypothetical protein
MPVTRISNQRPLDRRPQLLFRRMTRPRVVALVFFCGLGALAGCATTSRAGEVQDCLRDGRYGEAVQLAAAWREREPRSAEALEAHRDASAAYLLEQGRRATFENRDDDALAHFDAAALILPADPTIANWITKSRAKLAGRWLDQASQLAARDELESAVEAYERVLEFDPNSIAAREGAARALLQLNWRSGVGEGYYKEGVRALREYWLVRAKTHFEYSNKYLGAQGRVQDRQAEVTSLMAQDRVSMATELERQGLYWAAHNEYRLALLIAPDEPTALDGKARMAIELEASKLEAESERLLRRKDWAGASAVAEKGKALTRKRYADFEVLTRRIDDTRLLGEYEAARDLERDYRYEEAIQAYAALIEHVGLYQDCRERELALRSTIEQASELYQRALSAEPFEALSLLRQTELLWPDWRDVHERTAALEAALAPVQP